jgi:hypothetical protein
MATLKEKLEAAGQKAEEQKKERQARTVKGSHLTERIKALVAESGLVTEDQTGFTKVQGNAKGVKLYVAKKGGRVDFSGFTVQAPGIVQISKDEAKEKHLGKVNAQINFEASDEDVIAAVSAALQTLRDAKDPEKPAKKKKVVEATTSTPATTEQAAAVAGE